MKTNPKTLPINLCKYSQKNIDLNSSKVEIIFGKEYYETFGDVYPDVCNDEDWNSLYNDYGQLSNGRQFFKKDYNPQLTKEYK